MKRIISLTLILFALLIASSASAGTFADSFSNYPTNQCFSDGTGFGQWKLEYHGYGCVKIEKNSTQTWLHQVPKVSTRADETHASMVVGPSASGPFTYKGQLKTVSMVRVNTKPNPWEVAWVVWHHQDDDHFYYFIPKPNGWELGKVDPAYPGMQRYLTTGSWPTFPIGKWYTFEIKQDLYNKITVKVNGTLITTFTDKERPYSYGRIGLYNEDAHVHFKNISLTQQ